MSNQINVFAVMPVEIFMDDRLTKTDLRVLGAILTWRNKKTNVCWPKREQIAERCGLPLCKISTSTTHLVQLGWLKKEGSGGKSSPARYSFSTPNVAIKVTESVTVTDLVTVTESVTQTVTESVTQTVTDSVRGNKQTSKQTSKQTKSNNTHTGNSESVGDFAESVCVCLMQLGVVQVNPSHPQLRDLVEAGASLADFEFAGKTAVERGKGFSYALGIVQGCLQDRQRRVTNPVPKPGVRHERKVDPSFAEKYPHLC